ncbi:MAG: cobyric acid synthase [Methanoregula sp. PtaU1.Bin051]|nr:MAG: cobyric acid synthase [Methanoregula sp. PtaU1.Bin051]
MSLFIVGTASHVGKSTTVAAICRCLVNRGICVAPFKSQNMSLNSYVTRDGGEIGIAQAMQAIAARLDPQTEMNPVLLKPKGECVSQIVLMGHAYKDVPIADYYHETDQLLEQAIDAYQNLRKQHGQVIVEGAGGAAELNLYDRDIANIRLARALKIPIVLVADIERGGVFAQIFGTLDLLPEDIRPLVRGVIINKFRGDPNIFNKGIRLIEERTGVPVLGVVPYFDIPLPSEDSLSIADKKTRDQAIRIAVIRLPRISNFTDFELLERYAAVSYVPLGSPLIGYDCIIIPGTKNTVEDLRSLIRSGTGEKVKEARDRGVPVIGICGGYQMLGTSVIDSGVESEAGIYPGLGLLDCVTRFGAYEKNTRQIVRIACDIPPILASMGEVKGYEIHMGETDLKTSRQAFDGDGAVSSDGLVFGTYMHGLFLNPHAVNALLAFLAARKGVNISLVPDGENDPFDQLAELFEEHVRVDELIRILVSDPFN